MHVLSRKRLAQFWGVHPQAEEPLRAWLAHVRQARWSGFADIRKDFGSADVVGEFVVFNVGGNKYRLIAHVDYRRHMVFVRHILTHTEYDRQKWKRR